MTSRPFLRLGMLTLALLLPMGGAPSAHADAESDLEEAKRLINHSDWDKQIRGLDILAKLGRSPQAERLALIALDSKDWEVQIRAARTLGAVGAKNAQKALTRLAVLGDIQWIRDAAVGVLPRFERERVTEVLLHMAKTRKVIAQKVHALRATAFTAGPDNIKRLRSFAKNKDPRVAAAAIYALGHLGDDPAIRPEVLKTLRGFLKLRNTGKHFLPYMAVLNALGRVDDPGVRDTLVDELRAQADDDPYMPERVARALEKMPADGVAAAINKGLANTKAAGPTRRVARLAGRVRSRGARQALEGLLTHKDERVRSESARSLGLIGDPACSAPLEERLGDKSPFVRIEAITALSRVLEPHQFRGLAARIKDDNQAEVRLQYVVDVAEQMRAKGIEALKPFLEDKSWRVATAAVVSVGTLGGADDLATIQPYAKSRDWKVRGAAFEGFGRLRAIQSIPLLIEGLGDKDPVVRGVCLSNLQILSSRRLGSKAELWLRWWNREGKDLVLKKRSRMSDDDKKRETDITGPDDRYAKPVTKDEGIDILRKARILVIKGAWDKVEVVLTHLRIPHTALRAQELKGVGLNPNQIVLVNCEGNMDKKTILRAQWFVNIGGYLMSTDWALTKAVKFAFPGYVQQYARSSTGNDVVVVENAAENHPLNAGVFDNVPALKWWLEIQAFPITIGYPERTTVLVDSAEMRHRYGSSPMAAVWRWGLGKVQHSISHFFLQEEGMQHLSAGLERKVFAADNLGLSLTQIRRVDRKGGFDGSLTDETMKEIAPDYSMFRLIVNMVREKKDAVEGL